MIYGWFPVKSVGGKYDRSSPYSLRFLGKQNIVEVMSPFVQVYCFIEPLFNNDKLSGTDGGWLKFCQLIPFVFKLNGKIIVYFPL